MTAELIRIEVDPEDAATMQVGEELFGRVIVRVDRMRCLIWARPPSRWYKLRRWARHVWWRLRFLLASG